MAKSKITLIGFTNYLNDSGDDLFKNLKMPDGIDRDLVIDNILLRGGEFEVLYANPLFFKSMIGIWSDKWQPTFERWIKALSIEYDPLYNFDRHETYTDVKSESEDINKNEGVTASDSSISSGAGSTTNTKSAYDSTGYSAHDKADSTSSGTNSSSSKTNVEGSQDRTLNSNLTHEARLYGNIGVTTSQQMLEAELDIAKWNLYDHIADAFLSEFCIYTY